MHVIVSHYTNPCMYSTAKSASLQTARPQMVSFIPYTPRYLVKSVGTPYGVQVLPGLLAQTL